MFDLFLQGGPLFMGILTLLFLAMIALTLRAIFNADKGASDEQKYYRSKQIQSIGLLSAVIGFLGFLIGMYSAMAMIEGSGEVSQSILAGGLKIAMITPCYGLLILGLSLISAMFLRK